MAGTIGLSDAASFMCFAVEYPADADDYYQKIHGESFLYVGEYEGATFKSFEPEERSETRGEVAVAFGAFFGLQGDWSVNAEYAPWGRLFFAVDDCDTVCAAFMAQIGAYPGLENLDCDTGGLPNLHVTPAKGGLASCYAAAAALNKLLGLERPLSCPAFENDDDLSDFLTRVPLDDTIPVCPYDGIDAVAEAERLAAAAAAAEAAAAEAARLAGARAAAAARAAALTVGVEDAWEVKHNASFMCFLYECPEGEECEEYGETFLSGQLYLGKNGDFVSAADAQTGLRVIDALATFFQLDARYSQPDERSLECSFNGTLDVCWPAYVSQTSRWIYHANIGFMELDTYTYENAEDCATINAKKGAYPGLEGLKCSDAGGGSRLVAQGSVDDCYTVAFTLNKLLQMEPAATCPEEEDQEAPEFGYVRVSYHDDICPVTGEGPGLADLPVVAAVVVVATAVSFVYILTMLQAIFPWKAPVAKWILNKLGLLWCFEIDYPTDEDPEARRVEMLSATYRKSTEKCECTATVLGCCTIDGPTIATSGEAVDPSTSLFDPLTKLYRCIGLPGADHGCGKWCAVHGPNPDASNSNILFSPGAAIMQNCCGGCCAETDKGASSAKPSSATKSTSAFGFSNVAQVPTDAEEGTPGYMDVETTNP